MSDGDVTSVAVDGILSNDDVDGRMYTVIALSIKTAAGLDVERQSIAHGPFPRGEAWYTDAGALPAPTRGIVHVAVLDRRGDTDSETITQCIRSAMKEARAQRLTSLAIAAFGTGPRGSAPKLMQVEQWLENAGKTIVSELESWSTERDRPPLAVLIVLYEPRDLQVAAGILWKAASKAGDSAGHRDSASGGANGTAVEASSA